LVPAQLQVDSDGDNRIGEILVKGPMVTNGYYNNQEATENVFHDGWLQTGDLGYQDENGFLYMVERRNDLIISGGENIYPSEVESILSGMDQITEGGISGKADDHWGQVPVAFIVAAAGTTENDVKQFAEQHLAKYKHPVSYSFIDALPRNASNKLVRSELLDWLEGAKN